MQKTHRSKKGCSRRDIADVAAIDVAAIDTAAIDTAAIDTAAIDMIDANAIDMIDVNAIDMVDANAVDTVDGMISAGIDYFYENVNSYGGEETEADIYRQLQIDWGIL